MEAINKLFDFDKDVLTNHFIYNLNIDKKIKRSFNYLISKLDVKTDITHLSKVNWYEGKNYDWCAIKKDCVTLLIRKYRDHFTIYHKLSVIEVEDDFKYNDSIYGVFTYSGYKKGYDNYYFDIDNSLNDIFELISTKQSHFFSNSVAFIVPEYITVKNVIRNQTIYSYDLLIFACEELSSFENQIFSEIDMLAELKKLNVGDSFGSSNIVTRINTTVKDGYYHDCGIEFVDSNNKKSFKDVYCLTMYYFDSVFKK